MPPAAFIGQTTAALAVATVQLTPPAATKPGDTLLAVIACDPANRNFNATANAGWELVTSWNGATARTIVARWIAAESDPPVLGLVLDGAPVWIQAALIAYRGLDTNAAPVGVGSSDIAASTNFVCPSRTLAAYSDLYLGIAVVATTPIAVTPPAGCTERHETVGANATLEVFDFFAEAVGATGTKTATVGANRSGNATSVALATPAPPVAPTITPDVPGALGLTSIGV